MPKTRFRTSRATTASSTATCPESRKPILDDYRAIDLLKPDARLRRANFLSVDPGLQGTGIALWRNGLLLTTSVFTLPGPMKLLSWPMRADLMAELVEPWAQDCDAVVCEMMEFQGGGARGLGWRSGDMQRTTYFIGLLAGWVRPARFWAVPVHRWKGQLPKRVVEDRIKDELGRDLCKGISSHAWDAVGIGLWAMGRRF